MHDAASMAVPAVLTVVSSSVRSGRCASDYINIRRLPMPSSSSRHASHVRAATSAILLSIALSGCAANHRSATTIAPLRTDAEAARAVERQGRDSIIARLARAALARDDRTIDVLLLSGGGQHGAFGVGILRGWRSRTASAPGGPPMPRFDLVTGVSTGALQAPFAFLGSSAALDTLSALYRTAATSFAPKFDPWFLFRRTGGVVNTERYEATLARIIDTRLRDSLAVGFRAGRQLLVATTDFDVGTGRTWDIGEAMGVGAAADTPVRGDASLAHARDVIYTSTAIPGVFPPRVLEGHVHADGGVVANILAPLDADDWRALGVQLRAAARAGRLVDTSATMRPVTVRVWAIFNLWTHPSPRVIDPASRRGIAQRNNGVTFWAQQPQLIARLTDLAHRVNAEVPELHLEFRHVAVPWALSSEPGADKLFDGAWMQRLETLGFERAQSATPWDTVVPTPYAVPGPPYARAAASTGALDAPGAWALTPQGLGPLRIGALIDEAAGALAAFGASAGTLTLPVRTASGSTCAYVPWRGGPSGVRVMVVDERVARFDVDSGAVATTEGIRVGDTEARVRAAYGARLVESPHKYVPGGRYLAVPSADGNPTRRVIFETNGTRVTRYRAGMRPAVDYVEGCA